jgi:uncharacterized membrane protein YfcA
MDTDPMVAVAVAVVAVVAATTSGVTGFGGAVVLSALTAAIAPFVCAGARGAEPGSAEVVEPAAR